jgi:hypothetical protein
LHTRDVGGISVSVQLGPYDDSGLGLVITAENISVGISSASALSSGGAFEQFGISVREASSAERIRHWPNVSIQDPDRRKIVYAAARDALLDAEDAKASSVGFFTLALEVSRIPSWEVAEEIIKAVHDHPKEQSCIENVMLIASSPIQVSSFQFVLDNFRIIKGQ